VNIGEAASASGVSAKMIRYYESIGLIRPVARTNGNYRSYSSDAIHTLRFVNRARGLGFSTAQTSQLLALWQDSNRSSAAVKALALKHVAELEQKICELQGMAQTLKHLAHCCSGDNRPNCPILDDLSAVASRPVPARRETNAQHAKKAKAP
jgi:MerR family copper efflux transcriptional regulator